MLVNLTEILEIAKEKKIAERIRCDENLKKYFL